MPSSPSCIGELKEERESGETFNVCDTQLTAGLKGISAEMMKDVVIAYEPVWAIGTGLTATPEVRACACPCACARAGVWWRGWCKRRSSIPGHTAEQVFR